MKKVFFASDFHLGVDARLTSRERELQIIRWLDDVTPQASAIYLLGDIFEFWHEYKTVVPKGYTRLLGKLAEMRDGGLPITAFTGNHDLWMFGYFEQELGIPVEKKPIQVEINGLKFMLGHGDGLGPNDTGYKRMKKIFTNPFCQWCFGWIHPTVGMHLAHYSSGQSRAATPPEERGWLGDDREWLVQYANRKIDQGLDIDFFIFGHRHLPIDWMLKNGKSRYINLGEWMHANSFGVLEDRHFSLRFFENDGKVWSNHLPL